MLTVLAGRDDQAIPISGRTWSDVEAKVLAAGFRRYRYGFEVTIYLEGQWIGL